MPRPATAEPPVQTDDKQCLCDASLHTRRTRHGMAKQFVTVVPPPSPRRGRKYITPTHLSSDSFVITIFGSIRTKPATVGRTNGNIFCPLCYRRLSIAIQLTICEKLLSCFEWTFRLIWSGVVTNYRTTRHAVTVDRNRVKLSTLPRRYYDEGT